MGYMQVGMMTQETEVVMRVTNVACALVGVAVIVVGLVTSLPTHTGLRADASVAGALVLLLLAPLMFFAQRKRLASLFLAGQILATVCLLMLVSTVSTAIVLSGHGHDNNTDFKADPDADVPLLFELFAVVIATFAWQLNRYMCINCIDEDKEEDCQDTEILCLTVDRSGAFTPVGTIKLISLISSALMVILGVTAAVTVTTSQPGWARTAGVVLVLAGVLQLLAVLAGGDTGMKLLRALNMMYLPLTVALTAAMPHLALLAGDIGTASACEKCDISTTADENAALLHFAVALAVASIVLAVVAHLLGAAAAAYHEEALADSDDDDAVLEDNEELGSMM